MPTTPMPQPAQANASNPLERGAVEDRLIDDYQATASSLPGATLPWLSALREQGIAAFKERGLPHRRVEEWKYTDLKAALDAPLGRADAAAAGSVADILADNPFKGLEGPLLVFVDGRFNADLSDGFGPAGGLTVEALSSGSLDRAAWLDGHMGAYGAASLLPVHGLNLACASDGAVIRVEADGDARAPIQMVFVQSGAAGGTASHLRNAVRVEAGAKATILEVHLGAETQQRFATVGTDIRVADGGSLTHVKLQADRGAGVQAAGTFVTVGGEGRYEGFAVTTGGALTRNETHLRFEGAGGFGRTSGAALLVDRQHCDNTTVIDHAVPDCESHETFKNVLANRSRGVFQGKIIVREDAQRTDGYQLSQALLLHEGAEADTKPELEIFADDVKCSHGATVGELDAESIFYLRSRGIGEGQAKALLIRAFVGEVLDEISDERLREALGGHVDAWLERHRTTVEGARSGGFDNELGDSHAA